MASLTPESDNQGSGRPFYAGFIMGSVPSSSHYFLKTMSKADQKSGQTVRDFGFYFYGYLCGVMQFAAGTAGINIRLVT
jgi:hypothetical protein